MRKKVVKYTILTIICLIISMVLICLNKIIASLIMICIVSLIGTYTDDIRMNGKDYSSPLFFLNFLLLYLYKEKKKVKNKER